MEAPFSYTGGFGEAGNDFRAPFHKSVSQLSILTTARRMIDQGTYRSSACPYECTRRITRHQVVKSNEENLLTGLGLIGENFVYPGHADSDYGFSRFSSSGPSSTAKLRPMHMSHDVTLDQCDDIVQRHQLLAPHAVWMVNADHETAEASAERLGDCGLFLGARSGTDADIWRGFYRYARLVLRLGHFESWIDDDIHAAVVHSSSEGACNSGTSRVCLWWSEFDLDDEEYSCRPKRDASNIVTPATLLAALAKNDVAYPPPSPPPPKPPTSPPISAPSPGAVRCQLGTVPSVKYRKTSYREPRTGMIHPVPLQCWRWDLNENWPPFAVHKDLYEVDTRCAQARTNDNGFALTRKVQWEGDFRQSELKKAAYDPFYGNDDSCPLLQARLDALPFTRYDDIFADSVDREVYMTDARFCTDGTYGGYSFNDGISCPRGTHASACGLHEDFVLSQPIENISYVLDQLQQPTGPPFQSCFDEDTGDYECCRAAHDFMVGPPTGVIGQWKDETRTDYCHYPDSTDWESADGRFSDICDAQQTGFFRTRTGCKTYCAEAFDREGDDDTCMPDVPECNNWIDPAYWPTDELVKVSAQCICGPKLESLIPAGSYAQRGTEGWAAVGNAAGRRLHEEESVSERPWRWPETPPQGIDQFHGKTPITSIEHTHTHTHTHSPKHTRALSTAGPIGWLHVSPFFSVQIWHIQAPKFIHDPLCAGAHFDASDPLYEAIMAFRTDLIPDTAQCFDYLDLLAPPVASWTETHPHKQCEDETQPFCSVGAGESGGDLGYGAGLYTEAECRDACAAFPGCGAFDVTSDTSHAAANSCRFFRATNTPRLGLAGRTYCFMGGTPDACCVTHRGEIPMSRLWMQGGNMEEQSVAQSFPEGFPVGTAVHQSEVAAVGNFDNDDFPDILIGNRLYLSNIPQLCLDGVPPTYITGGLVKEANKWYLCPDTGHELIHNRCYPPDGADGGWKANHPTLCPPGSTLYCEPYNGVNVHDVRGTVNSCVYQLKSFFPDVKHEVARLDYRHGVQIGPKDFAQVYAGDVNGDDYDDVVGVYDDGSFEIFLTVNDPSNEYLISHGGVGFHSMGVQTLLVGHKITTVNFIGTLFGYGTNCRGNDWGCTSSAQRAVFVGTEDTDDYVWVSTTPVAVFPPPAPEPPPNPPPPPPPPCKAEGEDVAGFCITAGDCCVSSNYCQYGVCHACKLVNEDCVDASMCCGGALCNPSTSKCTESPPNPPPPPPYRRRRLSETPGGAGQGEMNMDFSIVFSPLANTKHRTLSSARFYPDFNMRHQALAIGTGAESPNSLAYFGTPGFTERVVTGGEAVHEESVGAAAARIAIGVNLICFANRGAPNRCHRFEIDTEASRKGQIMRMDYTNNPQNWVSPSPPPSPLPGPPPPPACTEEMDSATWVLGERGQTCTDACVDNNLVCIQGLPLTDTETCLRAIVATLPEGTCPDGVRARASMEQQGGPFWFSALSDPPDGKCYTAVGVPEQDCAWDPHDYYNRICACEPDASGRRLQSLTDDLVDEANASGRRLQSLTDDFVDEATRATDQSCWQGYRGAGYLFIETGMSKNKHWARNDDVLFEPDNYIYVGYTERLLSFDKIMYDLIAEPQAGRPPAYDDANYLHIDACKRVMARWSTFPGHTVTDENLVSVVAIQGLHGRYNCYMSKAEAVDKLSEAIWGRDPREVSYSLAQQNQDNKGSPGELAREHTQITPDIYITKRWATDPNKHMLLYGTTHEPDNPHQWESAMPAAERLAAGVADAAGGTGGFRPWMGQPNNFYPTDIDPDMPYDVLMSTCEFSDYMNIAFGDGSDNPHEFPDCAGKEYMGIDVYMHGMMHQEFRYYISGTFLEFINDDAPPFDPPLFPYDDPTFEAMKITFFAPSHRAMPYDPRSLLDPRPNSGTNTHIDTIEKCRALCDVTINCNYIGFLPEGPSQNLRPGCYMYSRRADLRAHNGELIRAPVQVWMGISYQHQPDDPDRNPFNAAVRNYDGSGVLFQDRECPEATQVNYAANPSTTFGEVAEHADVKIAFLDGNGYADVITVAGRDHVRVYRGTQDTQLTGDFSDVMPETLRAPSDHWVSHGSGLNCHPGLANVLAEWDHSTGRWVASAGNIGSGARHISIPLLECKDLCASTYGCTGITHVYGYTGGGPSRRCYLLQTAEALKPKTECDASATLPEFSFHALVRVDEANARPPSPPSPNPSPPSSDGRRLQEGRANNASVIDSRGEGRPPRRRLLTGDGDDDAPYSRFPGDARAHVELANVMQLFVADFDLNGRMDLFLHAPARSPGSCAQRCHALGRFGRNEFEIRHTDVVGNDEAVPTFCFCGPHYDVMLAPQPPPSPPKPPPSPFEPPSIPPVQSPASPPLPPPFP